MSVKGYLVLMTVLAVVSDSLLHPFYPQYFATVFGVHDPRHVGSYIAACALTVLLAFPLWALVARRVRVMHILVVTQLVTAALNVASWAAGTLATFWVISLAAMVFKASYLLIYPYVMSLEDKDQHIGTISLLAFVVHFGDVLAGLGAGTVFELFEPRLLFVVMAVADLLQVGVCLAMLRAPSLAAAMSARSDADAPAPDAAAPAPGRWFVLRLGAVMFLLYFSAYLTEPFFSTYWESLAGSSNRVLSGLVFALPAVAALIALYVNASGRGGGEGYAGIAPAIVIGLLGLALQMSGLTALVLGGRCLYGWALFQSMVRLDLLLFQRIDAEAYGVDFSKVNLFQGMGVLFASFAASALVTSAGPRSPFFVAAGGFVAGVALFLVLFRGDMRASAPAGQSSTLDERSLVP